MTELFPELSQVASISPALTPMVRQYYDIKQQYTDCLLLFRLGDFYELFFEDAVLAAGLLDIALTKRGRKEGEDIPMCGIPFHAADNYIARLVKQGHKVAICEQLESPEEAKKRGHKAVVRRDVVRVITAGTLTEDSLLQPKSANYLVAVCHERHRVALAAVDISTGVFFREVVRLEDVEGALARLSPKELLLMEGSHQLPALFNCFAGYKQHITLQPMSRFDATNGETKLKKRFNVHDLSALGTWEVLEVKAAGALIDYITLTQKDQHPPLQIPQKLQGHTYLQMDAATRRNLELVQTLGGKREGSLLDTIDYTLTSAGSRLLDHTLSFPLRDLERINARLDQVESVVRNTELRTALREALKNCPDGERTLSRLSLNRGGPRDVKAIQAMLETARSLRDVLEKEITSTSNHPLARFAAALMTVPGLENKIDHMIVDAPPVLARDGNFIRPGYLAELDENRALRDNGRQMMAALQSRYIQDTGISSLKIKFNMILGYYIDITATHKERVPPSFIHRQTLVNSMRYTTVELSQIEEKLISAADRCLQTELVLFQNLIQDILAQTCTLHTLMTTIAQIDLIASFGELAHQHGYTRPSLSNFSHLHIEKGRHPVIEHRMRDTPVAFVANTCLLDDQSYLQLLTGPNMAGKSTYLRQNALIIILAHMGCFVPADRAEIGLVDRLFSRVGASDDLARGQSTFMVEMLETAAIINQSTPHSFVILDEMGRGTSTYDGIALAWSTLEYLHNHLKCRALFATHYHELTTLAHSLPGLTCMTIAIKEWEDKIIFLHQVIKGTADRSYGIHVAELAGLPPSLIERAREILVQLETQEKGSDLTLLPPPSVVSTLPHEEAVLRQLRLIDVENMTPRDALDTLYTLVGQLQKEKKEVHAL